MNECWRLMEWRVLWVMGAAAPRQQANNKDEQTPIKLFFSFIYEVNLIDWCLFS